ncbi:hypothetical protein [Streptomyces brevispora]|uniref:Uncharacterized protein n=1 Tax=Streptomyces brevispora TaxID=887462 RepID=A0ABZ1G630_9ACTN|nr:hypothetical protein [Streptomyces brevispora]WSC14961.1 hypothetical protein OIE64_20380 [Streptomyces brevispora]
MDLETLREELHQTIDRIIDAHTSCGDTSPSIAADERNTLSVAAGEATPAWTYRWPGSGNEDFHETRWYELAGERGRHRVRVAWARRGAWGRDDRLRAIVFYQQGRADSTTYYPWTEFVETDDGRYAAIIPQLGRPRAQLRDGDPIPDRFQHRTVERTDALFDSIAEGRSMRFVVDKTDEVEMVRHGYWVATLRNRF